MSLNLGIIASSRSSAPSAALLLDTYPGAAAAYSLRKLRTAYTGAAIRVRRDRDNTEQDIGFNLLGELDTVALQSFVGSENYIYWSQDFTQSGTQGWTATGNTITSNTGIAPDGTNTANNCVLSAVVTNKSIYQSLPSVSTRNYVFSIYAKASGYNYAQLNAVRDSTNRYSIIVDLTTGLITQTNTVGTPNFVASSITSAGNGWYRIMVTLNINLGFNYFAFTPSPVSNPTLNASLDLQNAGNGTSGVLFWGAQLNYFALKPYQITTTSQSIFADGFIRTWYDQSGKGFNATQTTAANQPQIVSSGVVILNNSKPSVQFNGTSQVMACGASFTSGNYYTFTSALSANVQTGYRGIFAIQFASSFGFTAYSNLATANKWGGYQVYTTPNEQPSNSTFQGAGMTLIGMRGFANQSANSSLFYKNNASDGTYNNSVGQVGHIGGLASASQYLSGKISEIIVWNYLAVVDAPNISGINSNINSFYTIY